ncbi:uncharacterized protein ATNIH1004_011630 [Aspergillus tanneri]|uniref:Uncharacterized protein n=1 Tax=Aspergillus tanneri TaxID=1220188 RepID=A0A5M9M827_9EURO|nr:uncharacterized protein ATNIH1004_011630 [Aspergillus tanneri]KAA8641494.1 hypothetical protein ATNIH1004_011630 [Aspergillus tanneri]
MDARVAAVDSGREQSKGINLGTMFGIDRMGCEECSLITGPAAFFVDLLYKLNKKASPTMLDKLFKRREDLKYLQLSCANTKALKNTGKVGFKPFDANNNVMGVLQPQNTGLEVYRSIVQPIVSPMHVFPYNQGVESMRAILQGLGGSKSKLLSMFQSWYRITNESGPVSQVSEFLVVNLL